MNIVFIVSDTFRYDNLSDSGPMPPRTPELDRFAERAVSLSRMYTASFPTIPHRTDLTSGRYGWPWYPWQDRRGSTTSHAPELLRPAGYVSQLIADCPHLFPHAINVGFDGAYNVRGQEGDTYFLRMNHPIEHAMPPEKTRSDPHFQGRNLPDLAKWTNRRWYLEEDRFPPRTAGMAVEWLEENYRFEPFFLWVDFFDPHEPWDPPEYMVRRYDPDYTGAPMIHPNYGLASDLSPEELRNLRAHYCAEVELTDRWIGRVLQKIDDLDLWKNTVVVFTSDHGMSIGEHNQTGKSNRHPAYSRRWPIYPEIARVPCIIAAPGLAGGATVHAILQPPDILPTALDLAGVDASPPQPFHGRSFAPMLRGEHAAPPHEFAITASFLRFDQQPLKVNTPVLYTEEWAYAPIGRTGERELYELESDPGADANVADDHPAVVREMHERFIGWLKEMDAPQAAIEPYR